MRVSVLAQFIAFGSLAALPWVSLFLQDLGPVLIYAALWWLLIGAWCAAWSRNVNEDNE